MANTPTALLDSHHAQTKRFTPWRGVDLFFEETDDARLHKLGHSDRQIEELVRERDSFAVSRKRRS